MRQRLPFQKTRFKLRPDLFILRMKEHMKLTEKQERGLLFLLDDWRRSDLKDLRWLAGILAIAYYKTKKTFQPIRERGKVRQKSYWPYYARGYIPLRGKENYQEMSDLTGIDFVTHPDIVLDPRASRLILFKIAQKYFPKNLNEDETNWFQFCRDFHLQDQVVNHFIRPVYHQLRFACGELRTLT